ncbi:MAG: family 10 glycosylhydrolase [Adhaeribacter sp.]
MLKKYAFLLSLLLLATAAQAQTSPLAPKREFRGVWVATVENIDWPAKPGPGQNSKKQRQDLLRLLDAHQQAGINAIMLQVRPAADAFYAKGSEPWSRFLTGRQGQALEPFYDPLAFAVAEAHKRGMELHAWFNPYRATTNLVEEHTSAGHITRRQPDWFFTYGGKKYFNPGLPEVRQYIVQVIMNVVRHYDIDGVHFDDYFYPYPGKEALPDSATYLQYGAGRFADINDWRRHNVDTLIQTLSDSIHAGKAHLKFGISPFGIWRNLAQDSLGSDTKGLSGYSALYADARKWVQAGWLDYVNPQVYFPFHYPAAAFEKLVDWWSANSFGRHLYIGQAPYRAMEDREGWRDKSQLPRQVRYLRQNEQVQGSVYFSSRSLTNNLAGFRDSLRHDLYRHPALLPTMPWLDSVAPATPGQAGAKRVQFFLFGRKTKISWQPSTAPDGELPYGYVVYRFAENEVIDLKNPKNMVLLTFDQGQTSFRDENVLRGHTYKYLVTALDRLKNESVPTDTLVVTFR